MRLNFAKELNKRRKYPYMPYVAKWIQDYVSRNFGNCVAVDDMTELTYMYSHIYEKMKETEGCVEETKHNGFLLAWKHNVFKSVSPESMELCIILIVDSFIDDMPTIPEYIDELSIPIVGKYCEEKFRYLNSLYKDAAIQNCAKDNRLRYKQNKKVDLIESICEYLADIFNTYKQIQEARHV